jgi:hypothetical protein
MATDLRERNVSQQMQQRDIGPTRISMLSLAVIAVSIGCLVVGDPIPIGHEASPGASIL